MLLHWELETLSRAVNHANLSSASRHIGMSQPQLSRIVGKLEAAYGISLLDRAARRKSAWTGTALKLAQSYRRSSRRLETELQQLAKPEDIERISVGLLEGLAEAAIKLTSKVISQFGLGELEMDVYDLHELEEHFLRGDLDLIVTSREPAQRKSIFSQVVGHQIFETKRRGTSGYLVLSHSNYEAAKRRKEKDSKHPLVISNSLRVRETWIEMMGGETQVPSKVHRGPPPNASAVPVMLIGSETLGPARWSRISKIVLTHLKPA
jgi:DNA-binding transcriptional LysR family regulator